MPTTYPYPDFHRAEPANCRSRIPGKVVTVKTANRVTIAKFYVKLWEQRLPVRLPKQRKAPAEIAEAKTPGGFVRAKAWSNVSLISIFRGKFREVFQLISLAWMEKEANHEN